MNTFLPSLSQVIVAELRGDKDVIQSGLNKGVSNILLGRKSLPAL